MIKAPKQIAFVLGLGVNGYAIVRSLAREGVPIVGIHSELDDFGRFSRYCKNYYLDPSIQGEKQICEILINWRLHLESKPVLFATSDYHALLLAKQREMLSDHFLFHWVWPNYLSRIIDKSELSRICQQAGVLTPLTHITQPDEDLARSARDFPYPCVVKPVRSFGIPFPPGMKNFVVYSPKDLVDFYKNNPGLKGATIWQKIIEGGDENIFQCTALIRQSGEVGAVSCVRKIRQNPPGYGSMCFGRSEWNHVVVFEALKLLRLLGHQGFASLEFKYQPKDGCYYFIEMNPRLPWYSMLFADAGINLPYLGYLDLTEQADFLTLKREQQDEVYWINFKGELGRVVRTPQKSPISLLQWLGSMARARSYAWWEWKDPQPFLVATLHLVGRGIQRLWC